MQLTAVKGGSLISFPAAERERRGYQFSIKVANEIIYLIHIAVAHRHYTLLDATAVLLAES